MKLFTKILLITVLLILPVNAQRDTESLKNEALRQMGIGRYGEAIDLINKYITANPQRADGYNIRGLCYEKRNQLEQAVYDFRNARKLDSKNKEINENLNRATEVWYEQLYLKIEGYRREIAIDPNKAVNYLEIGKCYKNLGQWGLAEEWYDEYLKREEASADEVIRYTEILAKNNHIEKGEKILKIYVEKYPKDHRLWSRYGYFTLWLGKTKIAIEAFQNALAIRPYFLEAEDGLNQALGKGYVYSINDTSANRRNNSEPKPPPAPEYPIDKYYRTLKNNPDDDETRFTLIEELKNNSRFEEAIQQLEILAPKYSGQNRFENLLTEIRQKREEIYLGNIEKLKTSFAENPSKKDDLLKLTEYYNRMGLFDESMAAFSTYIDSNPNETDLNVRYRYAQTAAWNKGFNVANEQLAIILSKEPKNLKFQLLGAQLAAWTEQNLDEGLMYAENNLAKEPKNFEALISAGLIQVHKKNFDAAYSYVAKAKEVYPNSNDISTLELRIEFEKMRYEEEQLYEILEEGRRLSLDGRCEEALPKFEEYMSKTSENRLVQKEYADVLACAKNFDASIDLYNKLIDQEYDFDYDLERAKIYLWKGDSLKAIEELERLSDVQPDNFLLHLFLGDAYQKVNKFSKARNVFEDLYEREDLDSTQKELVLQRINWLPITGINAFLSNFPMYFNMYPYYYYFDDNTEFSYQIIGLKAELALFNFVSLAAGAGRGQYKGVTTLNQVSFLSFSSIYTGVYIRAQQYLTLGAHVGSKLFNNNKNKDTYELFARSEKENLYSVSLNYIQTDAAEILYSRRLIPVDYTTNFYQLSGFYLYKDVIKFIANYKFIKVSDDNKGEIYDIRIGRYFDEGLIAGYEYAVTNYLRNTSFYFSPQAFITHSLWGEYDGLKDEDYSLVVGGKIGIIPENSYIISDFFIDYKVALIDRLSLQLSGRISRTFREDTSYRSRSVQIQLFWSL